jgi:hypothetical protein
MWYIKPKCVRLNGIELSSLETAFNSSEPRHQCMGMLADSNDLD